MEIAFFTESYSPTRDGVATVVGGLARALERQGHSVRVYTPQPVGGAGTERRVEDRVPVLRVRSVPVPHYPEYRWSFPLVGQLGKDRFDSDVDVVHLHTPGMMGTAGFFAARRFKKPLVGTFHTNVWEMRESFQQSIWVRLFFRTAWFYNLGLYWRCNVTTAPSESARATLEAHARKPFRRPIEVIPNGIEVERFHPGITRPDWRTAVGLGRAPLVTFLGRLTQDKGVHRFVDALESLAPGREFVGIIGGSGPEAGEIAARLAHSAVLRDRVRFVGPVPEQWKSALLAQSDLFVLPSTSDTSSLALLEAMACGAPCVVSDVGGPQELVRDGITGRLFSVNDPQALPEAIAGLLDAPEDRRRMGRSAGEYARDARSIDATARRFISLYELLQTRGVSGAARITG
jgi:glycosyltransferase involved in cell wall biosynthesis